jgi:stage II sporulation protein D
MGFGHGVGMSQKGANTMAKNGSSYKEILEHYYKGIKLNNINEK